MKAIWKSLKRHETVTEHHFARTFTRMVAKIEKLEGVNCLKTENIVNA